MMPKISSPQRGRIGRRSPVLSSAAAATTTCVMPVKCCTGSPSAVVPGWAGGRSSGAAEDERERQTEDGRRLGEGEAEDRDALEHATGLGLTRDAVDVGGEDQADADTGADRRQAVAEDGDVATD